MSTAWKQKPNWRRFGKASHEELRLEGYNGKSRRQSNSDLSQPCVHADGNKFDYKRIRRSKSPDRIDELCDVTRHQPTDMAVTGFDPGPVPSRCEDLDAMTLSSFEREDGIELFSVA